VKTTTISRRTLYIGGAVALLLVGFLWYRSRQSAADNTVPLSQPSVPYWPSAPYYPGQTGGGGSVGVDMSPSGTNATSASADMGLNPGGGSGGAPPGTGPGQAPPARLRGLVATPG
jgi:hypothetical protein